MVLWILIGLALLGGWVLGWVACAVFNRQIAAENERLRGALRYVRGVALRHPDLQRLVGYLERLLSDEAGA